MAKRKVTSRRLAIVLARACAENRCRDVVLLDLRRRSPVTDFFVLATGTSGRQIRTVVERAREAARELEQRPLSDEGAETGWWALLDFFDVVVHVFSQEARQYYDLELLWGDAPHTDWRKGWEPRAGAAARETA